MKVAKLIFLSLIIFAFTSCKKNSNRPSQSNDLVFGHFYNFCIGEPCIEIFKLDQAALYEDTNDKFPGSKDFYDANYVKLNQQKFDAVKDLMDYFPDDLLTETNNVIGQPDYADGGGLYIEYNFNGVRKFWLIDMTKNNVPAKYHIFIDKVNEKIALLQ